MTVLGSGQAKLLHSSFRFQVSVVGIVASCKNGRESNLTGGAVIFTVFLRVYQHFCYFYR